MIHRPAEIRARSLVELVEHARALFARRPAIRSVMLAIARFWNDETDDGVHAELIASTREVPLWPHRCTWETDRAIAGETCSRCDDIGELVLDDASSIVGFTAYCKGRGPASDRMQSYAPYAVVRPDGVEIVGTLLHGKLELVADDPEPWQPGHRERELLELACADPADDGPRHVLADHLLDRGDPRGEYIALALSELDDAGRRRRDALLAEHRWRWIAPLGKVIPEPCARFERGLLAHAEVHVLDSQLIEDVAGAPAWASVETLRLLPGSLSILDPRMVSLRAVGLVAGSALETLATAPRPWRIESLHLMIYDFFDREVPPLLATTNLPRLRELTLSAYDFDWLADLRTAVWFAQLERLTILDAYEITLPWLARAAELAPVRWFCVVERQDDRPAGWELAYCAAEQRYEVRLAGFWEFAARSDLADLLARLPDGPVELVGNRFWQPTDDDVAALSRPERPVTRR